MPLPLSKACKCKLAYTILLAPTQNWLRFADNSFSGPLPDTMAATAPHLYQLQLDGNNFEVRTGRCAPRPWFGAVHACGRGGPLHPLKLQQLAARTSRQHSNEAGHFLLTGRPACAGGSLDDQLQRRRQPQAGAFRRASMLESAVGPCCRHMQADGLPPPFWPPLPTWHVQ